VRTVIIAGGQAAADEICRQWADEADLIIGADGGAAKALACGLRPDLVIGDMDSLHLEDRARLEALGCRFVVHPRAKDETDLELALSYAVQQGTREIVILGALGGRLDHALANLLLLALSQLAGCAVWIIGDGEKAFLLRAGEQVVLRGMPGDLVSLLPLGGDAGGVTATGLAWALQGDTLRFASSRGVSNEMTGTEARVELAEGKLWIVHSIVKK